MIKFDLNELLIDAYSEVFEQISQKEGNGFVQWHETKRHTTGAVITMPKFEDGSWGNINKVLLNVFNAITEKYGAAELKDALTGSVIIPEMMTKWEAERLLVETEPQMRRGFYHDRPTEYGKTYVAVHSAEFMSLYPSVLMQIIAAGYLDSDKIFWSMYGSVLQYRPILKAKLSKTAYMVLKLYINYGMMYKVRTDFDSGASWYHLVIDYAKYIMNALACEIGVSHVIYGDTDMLYADVSQHELSAAVSRLKCGIPCDINYFSELEIRSFKAYSTKTSSGDVIRYGRARTHLPIDRSTLNTTIHTI